MFYFTTRTNVAWVALGCGLLVDCIFLSPRLGFLGASYLLAALILYPARLFFFKEASSTLLIMTYLFAAVATAIQALIALGIDMPSFSFSWRWVATDCLIMPLVDVAYALLFFLLPQLFYKQFLIRSIRR
jgi:hypothetical protein